MGAAPIRAGYEGLLVGAGRTNGYDGCHSDCFPLNRCLKVGRFIYQSKTVVSQRCGSRTF